MKPPCKVEVANVLAYLVLRHLDLARDLKTGIFSALNVDHEFCLYITCRCVLIIDCVVFFLFSQIEDGEITVHRLPSCRRLAIGP
jgi:hypothetical protein